jgi:hypothetical protein
MKCRFRRAILMALTAFGCARDSGRIDDADPATPALPNGMASDSANAADRLRTDSLDTVNRERLPLRAPGPLLLLYEYAGAAPASPDGAGWSDGERDRAKAMAAAHHFESVARRRAPSEIHDLPHGRIVDVAGLPDGAGVMLVMPGQPIVATSLAAVRACEWSCLTAAFERLNANRAATSRPRAKIT